MTRERRSRKAANTKLKWEPEQESLMLPVRTSWSQSSRSTPGAFWPASHSREEPAWGKPKKWGGGRELSFPPGCPYLSLSLGPCSSVNEVRLGKENGVRKRLLLQLLCKREQPWFFTSQGFWKVGVGLPRVTLAVSVDCHSFKCIHPESEPHDVENEECSPPGQTWGRLHGCLVLENSNTYW